MGTRALRGGAVRRHRYLASRGATRGREDDARKMPGQDMRIKTQYQCFPAGAVTETPPPVIIPMVRCTARGFSPACPATPAKAPLAPLDTPHEQCHPCRLGHSSLEDGPSMLKFSQSGPPRRHLVHVLQTPRILMRSDGATLDHIRHPECLDMPHRQQTETTIPTAPIRIGFDPTRSYTPSAPA